MLSQKCTVCEKGNLKKVSFSNLIKKCNVCGAKFEIKDETFINLNPKIEPSFFTDVMPNPDDIKGFEEDEVIFLDHPWNHEDPEDSFNASMLCFALCFILIVVVFLLSYYVK